MFPSSISQPVTALGFHAPLPGLTPAAAAAAAAAAAGAPVVTQSLSASVCVYNAAPSAASALLTTVVSITAHFLYIYCLQCFNTAWWAAEWYPAGINKLCWRPTQYVPAPCKLTF